MTLLPCVPSLLGLVTLRFEPNWRMPRHRHPEHHEMIFLCGGRIIVNTQGRQIVGGAGEALVYPQGKEHEEWAEGGSPLQMFCLAWDGPASAAWPLIRPDRQGRMAMLLEWMGEKSPARGAEDKQTLDALLAALLAEYTGSAGREEDERLTEVRRFVQEHLAEPLCLDDLARVACLSRFHFASLFRAQMGVPPMDWVRRARVEAARTLLLTSTLPLAAIAPRVGLGDEFHLSRVFRRVTGRPASALRRAENAGTKRDRED